MLTTIYQFMVNCTLPEELCEDFIGLVPYQRLLVNEYLQEGRLLNYALSEESGQLWAIFNANSEMEVLEMLAELPLTPFMEVEISMLSSFSTKEEVPEFSLN